MELKDELTFAIEKLESSLYIQDSSAKLMTFLVQDLLDYAQIKSNKFRINLAKFDIRDTVEKIMCIQREKAKASNLEFEAEFVNFAKSDAEANTLIEPKKHSPILYSDG